MKDFDILNPAVLLLTIAIFVAIFSVRKKTNIGFSSIVVVSMVIGVGIGILFPGHTEWVVPIGKIYISVLSAIVAPLILVSILSSVTSLGSIQKLKSIGAKSVLWLLATTLIGIMLAIGLGLTFGIGKGSYLSIEGVSAGQFEGITQPFSQVLIDFFPRNIINDIADEKIIPIILFAVLIAVSYVLVAGKSKKSRDRVVVFKNFIEAVKEIIYKAVNFIIELTPYAVLALVANSADKAVSKGSLIWSLIVLLIISFVAFIIDTWGVNAVLLRVFANISPIKFFKKIVPAQVVAFSTQSSVGTLPVSTKVMKERIGVGSEIVDFTLPLGTTIGMPGCAGIWPALVAIYGIHGLGYRYSISDYLLLIVICLFVSLGTAGVPGTATITTTSVLTALGLPLELIVLTIPITAIADTGRTACNVTGAMVAAAIVGHEEGELDESILLTEHGKFESDIDRDDVHDGQGGAEYEVPTGSRDLDDRGNAGSETESEEYEVPTGSCSI